MQRQASAMLGSVTRNCAVARKKRIGFGKQCQADQHGLVHGVGMEKLSIRNILVPIDFSKMSIQAIETAKRLALRFGEKRSSCPRLPI